MPLKHFTETLLIVVLAVATLVFAILVRTAPPFPTGFVPLLLLFGAGLVYAAAFSPMLRRNRADYSFRLLHLAPAAIALIGIVFGLLKTSFPSVAPMVKVLSWGFFLPFVILFFALVVIFCLSVIRRRWPRLTALGVLLLLFVPLAAVSESSDWDEALGATVWGIALPGHPVAVLQNTGSGILKPGETWGERLESDLAKRKQEMPMRASQSSSPSHLPKAGPEMPFLFFVLAGYCVTLQVRAKRRALA
jgi:peptidoglycan/LPS O-acetylase OafA/YrhL